MSITIDNPNGEGEIEVFTAEEVAAKAAEEAERVAKEKDTVIATLGGDLEKERKFHAQQADNFKRLKDMTEAELSKLSASEIEARKIAEKNAEDLEAMKAQLAKKEEAEATAKREALFNKYTGGDKVLREKLESELSNVAIDDIDQKFAKAAILAGFGGSNVNPLTQPYNGEPPRMPREDEKNKFFESEKGKAAVKIMDGIDSGGFKL